MAAGLRAILRARQAEGGAGVAAAWPRALARAARDGARLDLHAESCRCREATLAELLDRPLDLWLLAVLEGPGEGLGLLALSPAVLCGLVEWLTLGRVMPQPPAPRRPTRTDAAMAAALIDRALAGLDAEVEAIEDRVWAAGFRYASCLGEARALGLILEDAPLRLIEAEVALAGGARRGEVLLALPAAGRGRPLAAPGAAAAADAAFREGLAAGVDGAAAVLEAHLARVSLPLGQVMALAPGELLRLPGARLDRLDLTAAGQRVAGGRLGQARGMRALRLDPAAEPLARGPGDLAEARATEAEAPRRAAG